MDTSDQLGKWHDDILPQETKKALDYLAEQEWLSGARWYLAGGTALALQVGHRTSLDLDFFTPEKSFSEQALIENFPEDKWETTVLRTGTIYGNLLGAKVSFIAYPFFLPTESFHNFGSVKIVDVHDIAVMKVIAISQRGTKRDFVDLYWYCHNQVSLEKVIEKLPHQYPKVAHNYHHILKSLTYFDDAEADPMPEIFFRTTWKEVKTFFQKEVPRMTHKFVGLTP